MSSPELDERFADWVDGRLSAAEREALETELQGDPALRAAADDYRATVELLRSALADDERAPDGLTDAIVAAARDDGGGAWHRRAWWAGLAAAAVLAAYIGLTWGDRGQPSTDVAKLDEPAEESADLRRGKSAPDDAARDRSVRDETGAIEELEVAEGAKAAPAEQLGRAVQQLKEAAPEPTRNVLEALEVELRNQRATLTPPPAAPSVKAGAAEPEREGARARRQRLSKKAAEPKAQQENEAQPQAAAVPQLVMVVPVPENATDLGFRSSAPVAGRAGEAALPSFLTAPEVMGDSDLGNRLELTVSPTSTSPVTLSRSYAGVAFADQGPSYQPVAGDQLYMVQGTEQDLPVYFTRLQNHLAGQGSELQVQWAPPGAVPPQGAARADGEALFAIGQTAATEKQAAALRSILLVLRQRAAAAQRDK